MQGVDKAAGSQAAQPLLPQSGFSNLFGLIGRRNSVPSAPALTHEVSKKGELDTVKVQQACSATFKHKKSTFDFSYIQGASSLVETAPFVTNVEEINLRFSAIPEEELLAAIPILKKNNPGLKKLNLEFATISLEAFKAFLDAFPELEELKYNILLFNYNNIISDPVLPSNMVLEWANTNPKLKVVKPVYFTSQEQFNTFAADVSSNLESIVINFTGSKSDVPIMNESFPAFAARCQKIRHLTMHGWQGQQTLTLQNYQALPSQLPNLEHLYFDGPLEMTSAQQLEVLLQLKKTTCLNFGVCNALSGADTVTLINTYASQLERVNLGKSSQYTTEDLQNISSVLSKCPRIKTVIYPEYAAIQYTDLDPALTNLAPILGQLENFSLNWSSISSVNMQYLGSKLGNDKMTELSIYNFNPSGPIPKMNVEAMAEAFGSIASRSPNLQKVYLYGIGGGKYASEIWGKAFSHTRSLRYVKMIKMFSLSETWYGYGLLTKLIKQNGDLRYIITDFGQSVTSQIQLLNPKRSKTITFSYSPN